MIFLSVFGAIPALAGSKIIVLILFLYAYFMLFFFNPPANFILRKTIPMFIFIYPVIHISIGLATFNWSGKWSLLINVPLFVICLPMIIASTSNDLVGLTMFLMTIYYLVPFIINIIVCQELLRWSRMERIKTLLKEQKRMSKTLNKLKADKKVHGFPEETYKKILNDHNYKMNKIKKEMEGIEAKIK